MSHWTQHYKIIHSIQCLKPTGMFNNSTQPITKGTLLKYVSLSQIFIHLTVVFWLVNTSSYNNKDKPRYVRKIVIFTGKSIYKRETVSNKNIGLVIE